MIYWGRVEKYEGGTILEFSSAAMGLDRRFIAEVSGNSYEAGDRIVVCRIGGSRSEGFAVVGNLTRGLVLTNASEVAALSRALALMGDRVGATETGLSQAWSELNGLVGRVSQLSNALGSGLAEKLDKSAYTASDVIAKLKGVDGAGSGLDADLLDGKHASAFVSAYAYTADDVLAKLKTVHGPNSGLDADTLDGKHAGDFVLAGSSVPSGAVQIYDFNTATTPGFFYAGNAQNAPENGLTYSLVVMRASTTGSLTQIATDTNTPARMWRRTYAGSWGAWTQLADANSVPIMDKGRALLSLSNANYAGGTFSFSKPFASAPYVVATIGTTMGGSESLVCRIDNVTTTNMRVNLYTTTKANVTLNNVPVNWIAMQ